MRIAKSLAPVLLSLATYQGSHAAILFDNLNEVSSSSSSTSTTVLYGQQFTTGNQAYSLDFATLLMSRTGSGNARVEIWNGSTTVPTSFLGSLTLNGSYSPTLANTKFTTSGVPLSPNSSYWIVLGAQTAGNSFSWSYTGQNTDTEPGYTTLWAENSTGTWVAGSGDPFQMSVSVTPVPEPSQTVALTASICAVFAGFIRFRRSKSN